ncbi:MAG: TIM barrel protein [Nocardiopsaceae bacterium]|jgi:hydroxypyruvate isomerase|nr:TIM barrel protein [Nocardiopsaceae bacterium]
MSRNVPLGVNCSILFSELPLLERPAAAKAAGFGAVEFWWPFSTAAPGDAEVDAFTRAVSSAGVQLIGLNFAAGDMPAGDRGLVSWPGREPEFRDSVQIAAGIGERLGTKAFNALYGNRLDDADPGAQDELAAENLAWAASQVAPLGAAVLLEPVSGSPRYPLLTAKDVVTVIERVEQAGVSNLRLLADFYHLAVNGDDLPTVIAAYGSRIGHIQLADAPGRHRPGTGELDLDGSLDAAAKAGYAGTIALEYLAVGDTAADLAQLNLAVHGG